MRFSIPDRTGSSPLLFVATMVAVGVVLVGSCARPPSEDPAALRAGVVEAEREFVAAFAAKDAQALGLLFTEEAALLPPNAEPVLGREAITKYWASLLILPLTEIRLELVDLYGSGETVTGEGRYALIGEQEHQVEVGKSLIVWKKTAQGWRIHRDLWNADAPATAAPGDTTAMSSE
jgi:ketosteroid isomerase-like protein